MVPWRPMSCVDAPLPAYLQELLALLQDDRTCSNVELHTKSAVHALIFEQLRDESVKVRAQAVFLLAWCGADRTQLAHIALAACSDPETEIRKSGLYAIVHSAITEMPRETIMALVPRLIKETDPSLRLCVVTGLSYCADHWTSEAIDALVATLADPREIVRSQAAHTLFERKPERYSRALRALVLAAMQVSLQHDDPEVRRYASSNLRNFAPHDPAPLPHLLEQLTSSIDYVLHNATQALLQLNLRNMKESSMTASPKPIGTPLCVSSPRSPRQSHWRKNVCVGCSHFLLR